LALVTRDNEMSEMKTALVLGATGGSGGEIARALLARGWRVRALNRDPGKAAKAGDGLEWMRGDALDAAAVARAAEGASVIVHAVNPPGYRNWKGLALPMLESTIAAAQATGALIVFPGTVYNFAPETFPLVAEDAPQRPRTRKGKIRVTMERRLLEASRAGARVLILRAGDYFGPNTANSWFGAAMVKPGRRLKAVVYPGRRDVGHAWAYLPDLAETAARLVERRTELAPFEVFHFGGHWFERGVEMAEAVRAASGNPRLPIRSFPWLAVRLLAPFVETFREMLEMTYLWRRPLRLDNRKLVAVLGEEPHTPTVEAVRASLEGLGCLGLERADNPLIPAKAGT
jgi:nucleoside-diphosphate-sugar epimerase